MLAYYYAEITLFFLLFVPGRGAYQLEVSTAETHSKSITNGVGGQPPRPASPLSFAPIPPWAKPRGHLGDETPGNRQPHTRDVAATSGPQPQARPARPRRVPGPPPPASSHRHSDSSSSPALPRAGPAARSGGARREEGERALVLVAVVLRYEPQR